jgi:hypothetical protein
MRWTIKHTNLGTTYADHNLVDNEIRQADVDWTLLRPVMLTDSAKTKDIHVCYVPDKPASMRIGRREVARFAVHAVCRRQPDRHCPNHLRQVAAVTQLRR